MPAVKNVGEPCAGEPHARFDGGREETSASRPARAAPGASRLPDQPLRECRMAHRAQRWVVLRYPLERNNRWQILSPPEAMSRPAPTKCTNCGYEPEVSSTQSLPPCPSCENGRYETVSGGDSVEDPYPDRNAVRSSSTRVAVDASFVRRPRVLSG
jgi:hypothetical protein